ncbi:MAG: glycosyl transferase family 2 [Crocinitomicaceae bacterium]|nr:glycosyl transferase family 2 [Crocinitomicaceae bacterium]|tara:strand:+ start:8750 stop:9490 length:741 start_codon:yes stop_codon:yes gene_type:complete
MGRNLIIIPCYNEGARLEKDIFIRSVEQYNFDLLLVNDGSKDDTIDRLNELAAAKPESIRVLDLPKNKGKAEAVREGMNAALKWKNFDIVGYADADLATPFAELDRISHLFKPHHSFLFGSRVLLLGHQIERLNSRWLFGRISAGFAALTLGLGVHDTQCGAKFFKSDLIPVLFDRPFLSRWLFDVELFFRMMNHFGKAEAVKQMIEIPLEIWIEMGDSKLTVMDILKVPFELLRIRWHYQSNAKG